MNNGITMATPASAAKKARFRLLAAMIAVALAVSLAPAAPAAADSTPVAFPDANLEAKVRASLGGPVGPITQDMMAGLTTLEGYDAGIANLTGLECATNLSLVQLGRNSITNLTPLAGLSTLSEVSLFDNQISDVSALSGLTNLTVLAIGTNPITTIAPLASLTKLTHLDVSYTDITTISTVTSFTGLTNLSVYGDADVNDLTPVAGLTSLRTVSAGQTGVTNLGPLAGLTNLEYLDLGYLPVTNLAPLAGLTELVQLNLFSSDTIEDVSPLIGLTKLSWLNLSEAEIYDISGLANLNAGPGTIYLRQNWLDPFAGSPAETLIATLESRGYTVHWENQKSGGAIMGTVTDGSSPLAGVTVALTNGPSTKTGADGSYVIGLAKPGERTLTFSKATYTTASKSHTVAIGVTGTANATLALAPGTISGRVTSRTGVAVAGVRVSLDGVPGPLTSANGGYSLPATAGAHSLTFAKAYYAPANTNVTVSAGGSAAANVVLTPLRISQTISRSPNKASLTYKRKRGTAKFTLAATVADARGAVAGQWVWLQKSSNGRTWKNAYKVKTSAAGKVSVTIKLKKRQTIYYRWSAPQTTYDFAKTTAKQKVRIK